jgi:hypothetical protein
MQLRVESCGDGETISVSSFNHSIRFTHSSQVYVKRAACDWRLAELQG